jgi:hypothetical protein
MKNSQSFLSELPRMKKKRNKGRKRVRYGIINISSPSSISKTEEKTKTRDGKFVHFLAVTYLFINI